MQIKKITYFVSTIMAISLAGCGTDSSNQNNKTDATTAGGSANTSINTPNTNTTSTNTMPDMASTSWSNNVQKTQSLVVKVTDVKNQPVANAIVKVDGKKQKTNKLGFAIINKVSSSNVVILEVMSKGFVAQSVELNSNDNLSRVVALQLKEQPAFTIVDNINVSTDGSSSSISGGIPDRVMCPANYDPVCVEEEVNGKIQFNTYSNECDISNGTGRIIKHTKGACSVIPPATGTKPASPIIPDLGVICTSEYKPVCAEEEVNGKIEFNTYSNECQVANGKGKLINTVKGACPVSGAPATDIKPANPIIPDLGVICTSEYKPVCAEEEVNGKIEFNTYSNECQVANGKGKLINTVKGACPVNGTTPQPAKPTLQPAKPTLPGPGFVACPAYYDPICVKEEVNGKTQFNTYSNDCVAEVQGIGKYISQAKGACPAVPNTPELQASITYGQDSFESKYHITAVGKANVSVTSWDIQSREDMNSFPGLGSAQESTGGYVQLHSLGAVNVKVLQNHKPLSIRSGKSIKVTTPLSLTTYDDGRKVLVGDSIPLWHFSNQLGIWKQEGTGTVKSQDNELVLEASIDKLGSWSWGTAVINTKPIFVQCQLNDGSPVPCSVETDLGSVNSGYSNAQLKEIINGGSNVNISSNANVASYVGRYYDAKNNVIHVGNVYDVNNNNITIKLNEVESATGSATVNNKPEKEIKIGCLLPNGQYDDKCLGLAKVEYSLNGQDRIKPLNNKFEIKDGTLLLSGIPANAVITKVDVFIATLDVRYFANQVFYNAEGFNDGIQVTLKDSLVNNNPNTISIKCEHHFQGQKCDGTVLVKYRDMATNSLKTKQVPFESNAGSPYLLTFDVAPETVFSLAINAKTSDESYYEYFDIVTGIKSEVTLGNTIPVYPGIS